METNKENYRQWMLGQIQVWDSEIAHLRVLIERLNGEPRLEGHRLMWELDKRHRELFSNYEDMMLAGENGWEKHREAVDAAAAKVQDLLMRYGQVPRYITYRAPSDSGKWSSVASR
jgi:hypothetical protein